MQKTDAGYGGLIDSAIFADMDAWVFDVHAGLYELHLGLADHNNSLCFRIRNASFMAQHGHNNCFLLCYLIRLQPGNRYFLLAVDLMLAGPMHIDNAVP